MPVSTLIAWIGHRWHTRTAPRVHTPALAAFGREVLSMPLPVARVQIEALRRQLRRQTGVIEVLDLGAGPACEGGGVRELPVARLVRRSACSPRKGALLHRLVQFQNAQRPLELGTNLGISAAYLASGLAPGRSLHSIEGAPALATRAREHLQALGLPVEVHTGDFEEVLGEVLPPATYQPDLVYLDGNHRYAPTLAYLDLLIPHMPEGSLLILDDIYWSPGMTRAWQALCARSEVSVSVDLFWLGLAWIGQEGPKEHLRMRW